MSRQLADLESILVQLISEHKKLLAFLESQQAAMRALDLPAMDAAAIGQEGCRLRIVTMETKRRALVLAITKTVRIDGPVTLPKLAAAFPQRREALLKLGNELKTIASAISSRAKVVSKVAGAVVGHLNTVMRVVAGAAERAGVYTRDGIQRVSGRMGVIEAVG